MSSQRKLKSDSLLKPQPKRKQSKPQTSAKLVQQETDLNLPQLEDVPKSSQEELFIRKLKFCSITYNFLEATSMKEKQVKFTTLKELILFVTQENRVESFTESTYRQLIQMVSDNVFRTLPPTEFSDFEPEYDEQAQEAAWPHLKLVYDLFLHFMNSKEINMAFLRKVICRSFIIQLIEVFHSEDPRERKCLKNMLLSIYLKLFEQRSFIRKQIRNVFLKYTYEVEQFNGIGELLEILSMAINGFNVPLRQEHKDFILKVLIPLHKPRYLVFYHRCLNECLKGYIRKDETLTEETILGMLKFWPKTCTEKEVLFLQEIGELLEVVPNNQFVKIQVPLLTQVASSIASLHFQVAETALNLWDNPDFVRHFTNNLKVAMPIVFPDLLQVSKSHWSDSISELANKLLRTFNEADSKLYNNLMASNKLKVKKGKKKN